MTIADRIRAAALGPTPRPALLRSDWISMRNVWAIRDKLGPHLGAGEFNLGTITERRMFLLFVACALENP